VHRLNNQNTITTLLNSVKISVCGVKRNTTTQKYCAEFLGTIFLTCGQHSNFYCIGAGHCLFYVWDSTTQRNAATQKHCTAEGGAVFLSCGSASNFPCNVARRQAGLSAVHQQNNNQDNHQPANSQSTYYKTFVERGHQFNHKS